MLNVIPLLAGFVISLDTPIIFDRTRVLIRFVRTLTIGFIRTLVYTVCIRKTDKVYMNLFRYVKTQIRPRENSGTGLKNSVKICEHFANVW